jgi:hypothetical protein
MKKILKITVLILAIGFIAIQFYRPDRTNPQVAQAETLQASVEVPPDLANIISKSCSDCHSNETVYPWYSNISPFSWFLANHIKDARQEMNFSVWNTYTPRKKRKKLEEVCEQLETKEMPLPSYLWIHRDAILSDADSKRLCDWAIAEKAKIPE